MLMGLPNLPDESVPLGADEQGNGQLYGPTSVIVAYRRRARSSPPNLRTT